ncbi:O-antigen ligase [Pseudomonas sp. R5(2019)]|uniref:O-antigen ligase family protein n=1 Tax=Pseudomonas sp. R5(2019) TaxID=2697566 RepID=UPI00141347BA|nr:O-antigen ligase family protein [Pseudomonas sp. R5(2019)]NBA96329.1 polymerase [Pseudomonas sp. R5(2019)]
MIIPLSLVCALALACLLLLASPWPFLAPGAVLGLVGLLVIYRKPSWALLCIIALVPLEGLFKDSGVTGAKLLGASLMLILPLQLALRQLPAERLRSNLWVPLLGFLALYLLSFIASEHHELSLGHLRELLIGLIMFVITLLLGRDLNLAWFLRLVSLSVALTCAMAMFSSAYQDQGRASGLLKDANLFAMMIAIAVPMALLLLLKSPNAVQRLLWLGCSVLLLAGMTKTESRSGLVVLLISLGIGLYHYRLRLQRVRPRHLGFVMLALALGLPLLVAVTPASYIDRIASLSVLKSGVNAYADDSLGRRASYIVVGKKMIEDNPLLGTGPGTFPLHYANTGYSKAFASNSHKVIDLYRRAHNTYLELFSEVGIPGGLLFVSLIAMSLYNMARARRACLQQEAWAHADVVTHLGMSVLAMALFLMFLSVPNQKYVWVLLAMSSVIRVEAERRLSVEARA